MGRPAGVFQCAQPRPHRQGGASCLRGVLLCECQEQLCDAELWRLSLLMICEVLALFSFLTLRSRCACLGTAVQPLTWGAAQVGTSTCLLTESFCSLDYSMSKDAWHAFRRE